MPAPSVTYTFTNGTTADGPNVSTNFSDIINALTDGTKDITVAALSASGNVTLGNASTDTLTLNATATAITLNNAATDGGAVYFDGGTAMYVKGAADGASITIAVDASSSMTLDGDGDFEVTDTGAVDVEITANSQSTGDAVLNLKVNNASANTWSFRNDNSASDILLMTYNAVNALTLTTGGAGTFTGSVSAASVSATGAVGGDYFLPTGDDTSAPGANRLYQANVPKAWAHLDVGAAGAITVTNDHNIASASYSGDDITVNMDTNMADATYAVVGNVSTGTTQFFHADSYATTGFEVNLIDSGTGTTDAILSGDDLELIVMGDQ